MLATVQIGLRLVSVITTDPVGVPAPGLLTDTLTVNVTMPPVNDGLWSGVTLVVVSAGLVTCVVVVPDELEARKLVSPEYEATTSVDPAAVNVYVQVGSATTLGIEQSTLLLVSRTVAEPVGVPLNCG